MSNGPEGKVRIESESDIVNVRKTVREITTEWGFSLTDATRIVTAASELARNVFHYAGSGDMIWQRIENSDKIGIDLTFIDQGPGIANVEQAMEIGYTTGKGLGLGLPGSKRLMGEMEINSEIGKGTTVKVRKWMKRV